MGMENRRSALRVPLQMFLNEYVADRPYRCMSVNLSPNGLFLNRLIQPMEYLPKIVGLEFELPGTDETIWAKGEVCYHQKDNFFHGSGVTITGVADMHRRLMRDYVLEIKAQKLRKLLATIRRNRLH